MSNLRAQRAGGSDSDPRDSDDTRPVKAGEQTQPARESEPPKARTTLVLAVVVAALWTGVASALLVGYFRAQTHTALVTWEIQFLALALIVTLVPPLLFIGAGNAFSRVRVKQAHNGPFEARIADRV